MKPGVPKVPEVPGVPILPGARCSVLVLAALLAVGLGTTPVAPVWREAKAGYRFEFPQDHASHPEFKIEWWYYTGNLQTTAGRRFGYQVTFFRVGVDAAPANPSRWAVRD